MQKILNACSDSVVSNNVILLLYAVPIDGHWGRWSSWNQCSATCGQGTRTRTRRCSDPPPQNGGKQCTGNSTQSGDCKLRTCGIGMYKKYGNIHITDSLQSISTLLSVQYLNSWRISKTN